MRVTIISKECVGRSLFWKLNAETYELPEDEFSFPKIEESIKENDLLPISRMNEIEVDIEEEYPGMMILINEDAKKYVKEWGSVYGLDVIADDENIYTE